MSIREAIFLDGAQVSVKQNTILRDVHMVINAGEFCYLKGPTGSGKSALLKGLYGLMSLTGGRTMIAGLDITELDVEMLSSYRKKIGLIADYYGLFNDLTIFQNLDRILNVIGWSVASEREMRIHEVLDQLAINHLKEERIADLPSGVRQKVMIARSVLHNPSLILADNPMVFLDQKSIDDVMNLFIDMVSKHKTALLCAVSDDSLISRYPSRSYYCADGTVTESFRIEESQNL
jgi:ABC-type antimicrobial peptide transport system, ATPase component